MVSTQFLMYLLVVSIRVQALLCSHHCLISHGTMQAPCVVTLSPHFSWDYVGPSVQSLFPHISRRTMQAPCVFIISSHSLVGLCSPPCTHFFLHLSRGTMQPPVYSLFPHYSHGTMQAPVYSLFPHLSRGTMYAPVYSLFPHLSCGTMQAYVQGLFFLSTCNVYSTVGTIFLTSHKGQVEFICINRNYQRRIELQPQSPNFFYLQMTFKSKSIFNRLIKEKLNECLLEMRINILYTLWNFAEHIRLIDKI